MNSVIWVRVGAIVGALGVLLGSFGAHGLAPTREALNAMAPSQREPIEHRLANFDTGVRYHMYHALAIVGVGLAAASRGRSRSFDAAGWLFLLGIAAFSGALYGLGVGGPKWLGMVAPIGGLALIFGWIALAVGASDRR